MTNPLLLKRLYRSLLRAAKPFSSPAPNASVLSCLLHRTGIDDGLLLADSIPNKPSLEQFSEKKKKSPKSFEEARDLTKSYAPHEEDLPPLPWDERKTPSHVLFRRLLREVVTEVDGFRQMQFPSEVDTTRLESVIRREFRNSAYSVEFNDKTRQEVAFLALRELNKKLRWNESLSKDENIERENDTIAVRNRRQAAKNVFMLNPRDPESYLKAGTYLVAHPLLTGFFRRTVICILDHTNLSKYGRTGGTYGLIVNRIAVSHSSGKRQTLKDVLRTLPPELMQAFGNCSVREGGPVHMSLQMIHARTPQQPALGGTPLSVEPRDETTSTALDSDRAIYYQGNMIDAADAVINGALDRGEIKHVVLAVLSLKLLAHKSIIPWSKR